MNQRKSSFPCQQVYTFTLTQLSMENSPVQEKLLIDSEILFLLAQLVFHLEPRMLPNIILYFFILQLRRELSTKNFLVTVLIGDLLSLARFSLLCSNNYCIHFCTHRLLFKFNNITLFFPNTLPIVIAFLSPHR